MWWSNFKKKFSVDRLKDTKRETIIILCIKLAIVLLFSWNKNLFSSWFKNAIPTIQMITLLPGIILCCFAYLSEIKNKQLRIILKFITPVWPIFWVTFGILAIRSFSEHGPRSSAQRDIDDMANWARKSATARTEREKTIADAGYKRSLARYLGDMASSKDTDKKN